MSEAEIEISEGHLSPSHPDFCLRSRRRFALLFPELGGTMRTSLKVVLAAIITGLLFWFFGGFIDFQFTPQDQMLWKNLTQLSTPDLLKILLVVTLFLIYSSAIVRDVNRQAEKLQLFTDLIDQSNDAIFVMQGSSGHFVYYNEKAWKELQCTEGRLAGKRFSDIDTSLKNKFWDMFRQDVSRKEHLVYESNHIREDGTTYPVEVNIKSVSRRGQEYLLAVCRDITERKRAEERYQTIIRTTKDGFFLTDHEGNFLDVNEAYCRLTNYRHDELMQMNIFDLLEPREETLRHFNNTAMLGSDTFESGHRTKNGNSLLVEASVNYIPTAGGRFFAFLRDITERKQMEEALLAEKERLAVTLRSIGDGVIATDTKGRIVLMNYVAEKLTGWSQEKAINIPVSEVLHLFDQHAGLRSENPVQRVLQTGKPVSLPIHTILLTRDGNERILAASAAPIIDRNQQVIGAVMVFQDKTMERLTEKELLKIEKLSSLGLLAGGIAHDLNNVLAVILGNISLAKLNPQDKAMIRKGLAEAEQAGLRARDLAKQLLTFARGGTPVKELASISEIIRDSAKFSCAGTQARCEISIPKNLWPAELDPGQISQVIQNLVINAVQAMPLGGMVHLKAENINLEENNPFSLAPGRYLKVMVEDQGVGIWPDHLNKIFDPYFTTKQKGSGLGLATAYAIIKNHDGHITVDSAVGKGTIFSFYLPAAAKKFVSHQEAQPELHRGKGKILVMDDEEMIRNNVGLMLQHLGYEAEFAEDGSRALELYEKAMLAGRPFDAIIMDLTVPGGMGGREAIQKLLKVDPRAKAIVFSGYSDDPVMSNFEQFGFRGFLKKPYNIQDFSEVLHKVLS
jgi:two-component system cell cycle sensor histidine kinase/response regulator CckA